MTREEWLEKLVDLLRCQFQEVGYSIPDSIKVSCGFPSKMGLSTSKRRIGECWNESASEEKNFEIFISPVLIDVDEIGGVLVHELIHTLQQGHRGLFPQIAKAIGLEGKMTATKASEELKVRLHALTSQIGPYPHSKFDPIPSTTKQTTRMIRVECKECGCIVRMTQKWLNEAGLPSCGCGNQMER